MISRRLLLSAPAIFVPKFAGARNGIFAPFNATFVIAGDSVVQALASISPSIINWYNTMTCQSDWANVLGGGRFRVPQAGNQAVGGQPIATIDANFTTDLAGFAPSIIYANGGPSDIQNGGVSAVQILSHWTSMAAQARAMGAFLIIQPIYDNSIFNGNAPMEAIRLTVNAGLATLAAANPGRIALVDISTFNYLTDCYPQVLVGPGSLVHPNIIGARKLATSLISIINGLVPPGVILQTASDPKNLFPLGFLAGTSGTLTNATGQVATGLTLDNSGGGGATVVGSKSVNPAGGSWQNVAISGTYTASSGVVAVTTQNALSGIAANKQIELTMALEVDAGSSFVDSITVGLTLFDATFTFVSGATLFSTNNANVDGGFDITAFAGGIVRVMPTSLASAAPAFATVSVTAILRLNGTAQPVACTFRFGQVGIRAL